MAILVLLRAAERGNYALYKDGEMVANYSHNDYRDYIDDQVSRWMDSEDDDVIEREHSGAFPESLENNGVKNERLKALGNKKPSQVSEEEAEAVKKPTPREIAEAELKNASSAD